MDNSLPQLLYGGARYYVYGLWLLYSYNAGTLGNAPNKLVTHVRVYHADGLGSVVAPA